MRRCAVLNRIRKELLNDAFHSHGHRNAPRLGRRVTPTSNSSSTRFHLPDTKPGRADTIHLRPAVCNHIRHITRKNIYRQHTRHRPYRIRRCPEIRPAPLAGHGARSDLRQHLTKVRRIRMNDCGALALSMAPLLDRLVLISTLIIAPTTAFGKANMFDRQFPAKYIPIIMRPGQGDKQRWLIPQKSGTNSGNTVRSTC